MLEKLLIIVMTAAAAAKPEWKDVADALEAKHAEEAQVVKLVAAPELTDAKVLLAERKPTHVAFVMRPEEVDFKTTVALKRMMRELDDDPYDDAVWGIVTGPTAADAKRIASSTEPKRVSRALATTGLSKDFVKGPFYSLSDGYPEGCWTVKTEAGEIQTHSSSNDISHVFAEGWSTIDPDFILTSSHASQRNLEMPFSRGNVVPMNGAFFTCPDLRLIDYRTGQAREDISPAQNASLVKLAAPQREKVWLAAGNCLIADNLRPPENMVMTALGFGKCNQFVGYIATTWFGEIGWGTLHNLEHGMSLVGAYHEANRKLIEELEGTVENARDFKPVFADAEAYNGLMKEVARFPWKAKTPKINVQEFMGRLWDRDATVFYGDPMQEVYLER